MRLLSDYQSLTVAIVRHHGGSIDKYMGDGILASFGATQPMPNYAANAARCMEEVLEKGRLWTRSREAEGEPAPAVAAALTTGQVMFGTVGDSDRLEYTVLGEPVNLAAKLEKHCKVEQVAGLIPETTLELAKAQGLQPKQAWHSLGERRIDGVVGTTPLTSLRSRLMLFAGFTSKRIEGDGVRSISKSLEMAHLCFCCTDFANPCHVAPVAEELVREFTLIVPDLRGYGDSGKPKSDPHHRVYSKRATGADMIAVMHNLGHERFSIAGHDRGGRVAHRMCLDYPDAIERAALLDIVPTATFFEATDKILASAYYHWFFLIQPNNLPERMIAHEPSLFLRSCLAGWSRGRLDFFDDRALAEYERCFGDPMTIHATCEDYRAGASIDLEDDQADAETRIACPLLILWGQNGLLDRNFDVLETWRQKASNAVSGRSLEAGHFLCGRSA